MKRRTVRCRCRVAALRPLGKTAAEMTDASDADRHQTSPSTLPSPLPLPPPDWCNEIYQPKLNSLIQLIRISIWFCWQNSMEGGGGGGIFIWQVRGFPPIWLKTNKN